jgi:hypothetical protein
MIIKLNLIYLFIYLFDLIEKANVMATNLRDSNAYPSVTSTKKKRQQENSIIK